MKNYHKLTHKHMHIREQKWAREIQTQCNYEIMKYKRNIYTESFIFRYTQLIHGKSIGDEDEIILW